MPSVTYYEKEADINNYIRFVREENVNAALRVSSAHFHSSVELIYVLDGEHVAHVNERTVHLKKGEIVFSNMHDIHYYDYLYDNKLFVLLIGKEYFEGYKSIFGSKVFVNYMNDAEKNRKILSILEDWYKVFDDDNYLQSLGYSNILLSKLTECYPPIISDEQKRPKIAYKMLEYLNNNYKENISLESFAHHMGYNKSYCSRLFSKIMKVDLRNYLNNIRVMNAWHMILSDSEKTIMQIAGDCGFESLNTFYRAFKHRFGKSPQEMLDVYRERKNI